jgi:penicillin amidase
MRRSAAFGVAIGGIAAALGGAWYQLLRRPLPRQEGTIHLSGLESPVEIRRDRWGVPHITARSERDIWFAQGFCHGQDRLWQCDFYRRAASGRLSEIAGAKTLPIDRFLRTLGLRRVAEREAAALDPEFAAALEAHSAGINAAARIARALPVELQLLRTAFEPWRPADTLAVTKLLSLGLSTNWERELLRAEMARELGPELTARLEPRYPRGNPVATAPGEGWTGDGVALIEQIDAVKKAIGLAVEASGSNNWAVSGDRTKSGKPLFAGDPHLPPSMPGIWYQMGLELVGNDGSTNGSANGAGASSRWVRGCSMPGVPSIYMGQTPDVAWSFTNVMADVMDLFVERISEDGETYEFEGEQRPLQVFDEEIRVKGRAQPERLRVRWTHHGPIVNDFLGAAGEQPLALRWSAHDFPSVTKAQLATFHVTSGEELVRAVEPHATPVSNMVWADRHGNIGYKLLGRLPLRRAGCPDLPKPGWSGEYEWDGWVPYDELPELVNPDCGFIVTANNQIAADDYPHHITSDYLDGYRARRIEELLQARPEHDVASFERIQCDTYSIPGAEVAQRLARLRPRVDEAEQGVIQVIERLSSWDGRMSPESLGATIYQAFILRLARDFAQAAIGDRDLAERWLDRADNGFTAHITSPWRWYQRLLDLWEEGDEELVGRPWDDLALDAMRGALHDLEERYGPSPEGWRWGHVHEMEFPHALGEANGLFRRIFNRRLKAGGAQETVSQIAYDPNDPFKAVWAPSWRLVACMKDPEGSSRWQQFTGQSGHPGSPHYDDLQVDWLDGRTQLLAGEGPWKTLVLEPA